ncbi:hypothetical protein QQ045_033333 [Rhodiola kirilowii]
MAGSVVNPKVNQLAYKNFKDFDPYLESKPGGRPTFLFIGRKNVLSSLQSRLICAVIVDTPEEDRSDADYLQNTTIYPLRLFPKGWEIH